VASLLVTHGYHFGVRFELLDVTTIGRSSSCTIQLLDEKVSRLHATIYAEGDGFQIRDEGSSNGTGLNGELLLEPGTLQPGDEVAVGNNLLLYEPQLDIHRDRGGVGAVVLAASGDSHQISELGISASSSSDSLPFQPAGLLAAVARVVASSRATGFPWLVLEAMVRGVGAERAAMIRLRDAGRHIQALLTYPAHSRVTIPRTLIDKVIEQGKGLRMDDSVTDLKIRGGRTRIETRLGASLCVPVMQRGRIEGILYLDTQVRGAFRSLPASVVEDMAILAFPRVLMGLKMPVGDESDLPPVEDLVSSSPAMRRVLEESQRHAAGDAAVLLTGEPGSGREQVARFIHGRSSRRRAEFVVVPCDALSEDRAESAIFGHEKGVFAGEDERSIGRIEKADSGTLLLREIGELPVPVQIKLLRAIQERRFYRQGGARPVSCDVRVMATSRRDLTRMIRHEEFREDLYRAMQGQHIEVPPLRDRADDIDRLIEQQITRYNARSGETILGLDAGARQLLEQHDWRGWNLIGLQRVIDAALVISEDDRVSEPDIREVLATLVDPSGMDEGLELADGIRTLETKRLSAAIRKARGRKSLAARILALNREQLDRRLAEYGVVPAEELGQTHTN